MTTKIPMTCPACYRSVSVPAEIGAHTRCACKRWVRMIAAPKIGQHGQGWLIEAEPRLSLWQRLRSLFVPMVLLALGCGGEYAPRPIQPHLILQRISFDDGVALSVECDPWQSSDYLARWKCKPAEGWTKYRGIYRSGKIPGYWVKNPDDQVVWSWVPRPGMLSWDNTGERQWMEGSGLVSLFVLEAVWP